MMLANSLDPDQARQNVGPDLGPNCLTLMVFLKGYMKTLFGKKSVEPRGQKHAKLPTVLPANSDSDVMFCS